MSKKLFVGNLAWSLTEEDLTSVFSEYGEVLESILIKDRATGRAKGFGFVTMKNAEDADKAVEELHGADLEGRDMVVNEAKPREPRA